MTEENTQLAHMVYFTLKEDSPEARQTLIAACKNYLTDHPGTRYFGVGTITPDLNRPVNDREFHVGLHIVFDDRAAHDAYQVSERHQQFIAENKDTWLKVRVFDSDVTS